MSRPLLLLSWCVSVLVVVNAVPSLAQETFTGEKKLACEAVLCLSSGNKPHECLPSLKKYLSIQAPKKKPWELPKLRKDFLRLCPSGGYEGKDEHLEALVMGAEVCELPNLLAAINTNHPPYTTAIPEQCQTLINNPYTTEYALPIRAEHCDTNHLGDLGPAPIPLYDYSNGAYSEEEAIVVNKEELEAFQKMQRRHDHYPTPICVSRWYDPASPVPHATLAGLLTGEVQRVDEHLGSVTSHARYDY